MGVRVPLAAGRLGAFIGLVALAGCSPEPVASDAGETGQACGDELPWTVSVHRSGYPQASGLWSSGTASLAHAQGAIYRFEDGAVELHEGLVELGNDTRVSARALDDAWVAGSYALGHWDGESLELLREDIGDPRLAIGEDGEVWMVGAVECTQVCPTQIWRWQDGAFVEQDGPPAGVINGRGLWAGTDGELWVGASNGLFAHRVDGGWSVESLDQVGFDTDALVVDGAGWVWAVDTGPGFRFAARDPLDGAWTLTSLDEDSVEVELMAAASGVVGLRHDAERDWIFTWAGTGPLVERLDGADLGLDSIDALSGTPEDLRLLSPGPRVHSFDPSVMPTTLVEQFAYHSVRPRPGSGAGVDDMLEYQDDRVERFDGQAWVELLTIEQSGAERADITGLVAEGAGAGWLWVRPDLATEVRELWRFEGEEASASAWQPPGSFRGLWSSGPTNTWLFAWGDLATLAWRWDGQAWAETLTEAEGVGQVWARAGDGESLAIVDDDAQVQVWADGSWSLLGDPLTGEDIGHASLARIGQEYLVEFRWTDPDDPVVSTTEYRRWDGDSWVELADPEIVDFVDDRAGHGWRLREDTLYYHSGEGPADLGWIPIELGFERTPQTTLLTSPGAVVVHDTNNTALVTRACD